MPRSRRHPPPSQGATDRAQSWFADAAAAWMADIFGGRKACYEWGRPRGRRDAEAVQWRFARRAAPDRVFGEASSEARRRPARLANAARTIQFVLRKDG